MSTVALHHRIVGPDDGAPLLLGGSLGTNLSMWEPQLAVLGARRRVIAFDHRGHGGSPAPPGPYSIDDLGGDVLALLDALEIARADYAGLSIGGMVGLWLAINAPERLGRLVIMCSSAKADGTVFSERAAAVLAAGSPAPLADAVVARWFTQPFAEAHQELVTHMREMVAATPAEGYAGCCAAIAAMDLRPGLPAITAPTLVIGAGQDPSLPAHEHSAVIAGGIPGARYEVVGPAAHLATIERADVVNALILEHLRSHAASAGGDSGPTDETRREQGTAIRRAVLGDAHVDRAIAATTPFTAPFQDFITRVAWGDIWARDGLDRRTRSAITVATLAALGREGELELHVRAAIRNGLTIEELGEVLLHTAIYAGVPAANAALALAKRVLAQDGLL